MHIGQVEIFLLLLEKKKKEKKKNVTDLNALFHTPNFKWFARIEPLPFFNMFKLPNYLEKNMQNYIIVFVNMLNIQHFHINWITSMTIWYLLFVCWY